MTGSYATKEAYNVYLTYLALGKHFTTDGYDFHKYNGKVKASADKFSTRNDVFFFYKLSKEPHWFELMLSNFIKNPKIWVRSLLDDTAEEVYRAWKKRIDSLTYSFKSELGELKQSSLQDNFTVTDGQMPHVMVLYLQKKISLETFSILAQVTNVYMYWEQNIVDKTVARDIIRLSKKYYPFLNIEKKKFSAIVKDKFDLG